MCGFGTRDHFSKGTYPDEIIPQEPKEEKYKIKKRKKKKRDKEIQYPYEKKT